MVCTKYGFASTSRHFSEIRGARPPILDENDVMFGSFATITVVNAMVLHSEKWGSYTFVRAHDTHRKVVPSRLPAFSVANVRCRGRRGP